MASIAMMTMFAIRVPNSYLDSIFTVIFLLNKKKKKNCEIKYETKKQTKRKSIKKKYNFSKLQSPNIIKIYARQKKNQHIYLMSKRERERNSVFLTDIFTN